MSNCNCIEKVVAAINAVSDDYTFEAGPGLRTALNRIVSELTSPARLAPPPATDCGKPSPAPAVAFDAERLVFAISKARDLPNEQFMLVLRTGIKEAESAGYARAKAEQTPRKWPDQKPEKSGQYLAHSERGGWAETRFCDCAEHRAFPWLGGYDDITHWLPMPAAPAAAKEGT